MLLLRPRGCGLGSAQQSLFNIIQNLTDFDEDKSVRVILIDIRHIPIEDRAIFFDQLFHVGDHFTAVFSSIFATSLAPWQAPYASACFSHHARPMWLVAGVTSFFHRVQDPG